MGANRWMYTFFNKANNRTVVFGPYESEDEAKGAFQRVYGFWPENTFGVRTYWEA